MATEAREEFERRLLALVRDYLDWTDKEYPDGFEVGDFVITWEHFEAPTPETPLKPWHGGPYPGWWRGGTTLGSSNSYLIDEQLLEKALEHIREMIAENEEDHDVESEESDESDVGD
jgi:hypothetical protein